MSQRFKFGFIALMATTMVLLMVIGLGTIDSGQLRASTGVAAQGVQPGDGLSATYFGGLNFTNPLLLRVDPEINFDFGTGSPDPSVGNDFAARWTGQIRAEHSGTFTFITTNDDGAVLKIDNQVIINDPRVHAAVENRGVFDMEAGKRYDISLDFFDSGGFAFIRLEWEGPQTTRQVIPQRVLYSTVSECSDKVDNDGDGLIDFGKDDGCEDANDNDEKNNHCTDGIDNDGDGQIDFPEDDGCSSSSDNDETDPATNVNVSLNTGATTTIGDNTYPLGIIPNQPNNIFVRARVGNRFEMVRMTPTVLPSFAGALSTASIHSYLLRGTDSEGKEHLAIMKGRNWPVSQFSDPSITSDPWFSVFAAGGTLSGCIADINQRFSAVPFYLDNAFFFQQLVEMLSLCQRAPSGATPNPPPTSSTTLANPALTPSGSSTTPISIPTSSTINTTGANPGSLSTSTPVSLTPSTP